MTATPASARGLRFYGGRWITLIVIVIAVGCAPGSSTPVAHLRGKVTIDGKPVPSDANARITFAPRSTAANRNAKPTIVDIVDGQYDAPDVPVGSIDVRFDIQRPTGREFARGMKETVNLVPEEHWQGMRIEIEEGEHTQDFEL